MSGFDWDVFEGMFSEPEGLNGLHVSRAGDFYWPGDGVTPSRFPPSAPSLTAGQVRARVTTGEVRRVQ